MPSLWMLKCSNQCYENLHFHRIENKFYAQSVGGDCPTRDMRVRYKNRYVIFNENSHPLLPLKITSKNSIFWYITQCSPLKHNRRFGATCRPPSVSKDKPSKKPEKLTICLNLVSCLAYSPNPEDGGYMFLRNVRWLSTDYTVLHLRRENSVRTSNPTPSVYVLFINIQINFRR
jgi:hypothetical protein